VHLHRVSSVAYLRLACNPLFFSKKQALRTSSQILVEPIQHDLIPTLILLLDLRILKIGPDPQLARVSSVTSSFHLLLPFPHPLSQEQSKDGITHRAAIHP
jgi:hypothetical protein